MTYNHEKFIRQALESVLMQKVNFPYEIIISEDCSTDSTRDIVINYHKKYPEKIRLILSPQNLHSNMIVARGIQAARGQYIALLDGDDYWTSVYKLQEQVDCLDNHDDCAICFHNTLVVYEDGSIVTHPFHLQKPNYLISQGIPKTISTLKDIVPGNFMQSCSVMFRTGLFCNFPDWYNSMFPITDWPLHVLNAEHGNIRYINKILGAYRVHAGGLWSMNMALYRKIEDVEKMIYIYETINRYFNFRYKSKISKTVSPLYYQAAHILFYMDKFCEANYYAKKCFFSLPFQDGRKRIFLLRVMLKAIFLQIYAYLKKFMSRT